ncbi:hypothetical protein PICMEDRAFT_35309 [Pichia membranifaciens NRRL Y-2026]|uniref:ADF-H domain-containing protein n=1 Tax=Pichia membranifaciens NRRL Y-2026 TaxID=763406 RepID=A0A1E3NIA7_9ASCO|nr:hypothetical protein PICMEDRAFT_35309 [Pichia membranifaciens NRRL Y-2026]ODQ45854.1 hypothetical protein PICMEDRAFT_35309 [Pichia membranifaciens NRRL Y-2026]
MSQSICKIPSTTKQQLRKFRLTPIKQSTTTIPTQLYKIDKEQELQLDESLDLENFDDLAEELPDNSPCYILMNYGYTKPDGRFVSPLVGIYWRPDTARGEAKMLYAGAVELFKKEVGCNMWLECSDEDEIPDLKAEIEK